MIYRHFAREYGYTPDQVNGLTIFQAAALMGAITPEHGRVKLTLQQAIGVMGQNKARQFGLL